MNNFTLRTITGAIFVIVIIGSVLVHHLVFAALFLIVALAGYREFSNISRQLNAYPSKVAGSVMAIAVYVLIVSFNFNLIPATMLYLLLLVPVLLAVVELFRKTSSPLTNLSMALFGIAWIVVPLALLSGFFALGEELKWRETGLLLGFFLILWIYDSGAYIFGSAFGKHKMIERISPKKSWEGFLGGAFSGLLVAYLVSASFTVLTLWEWLLTGVLIIVFGTFGDLIESMFKRNAGIKDSGSILPGHGGILDRFDAVLIAAPFVYILTRMLGLLN
ncbi:MAG: phosphatidate cytidylyltransferase [Omnitrophica WOR_2 bacterium]